MKTNYHADVNQQKVAERTARRTVDRSCSARNLCSRCSMIKIIQYRFELFRRAFGRDPLPNEPLFFAENSASPQMADRDEMLKQLTQAASATTVKLPVLLRLLGLE